MTFRLFMVLALIFGFQYELTAHDVTVQITNSDEQTTAVTKVQTPTADPKKSAGETPDATKPVDANEAKPANATKPAAKKESSDQPVTDAPLNSITITSDTPLNFATADQGPKEITSCDRPLPSHSPHFGRNGALTPREYKLAQTAWVYFEKFYQEKTGLVNAVGNFPSTTMWDTASYVSALVSAYELCIIDKGEFDRRTTSLLKTMRNLDLFQGKAPNKVYNSATGEKVDYANKPGEVGVSALDIGRMLIWLKILKERYPYLANAVDSVPMRWNFCDIVSKEGELFGAIKDGKGGFSTVQEGRLGYEEYAAKGFALWGFGTKRAQNPNPIDFIKIFDVDVPFDARDPRVYKNQNYVLTEGYILDGLELGWDLANDTTSGGIVASDGWRAEFATRIYLVQQRRFEQTGIITARSEHQVEGAPYFVYDSIFADGYPWNTMSPSQEYQPDRAAVSAKAAIGLWALWETDYTNLLYDSVAELTDPQKGVFEGVYENGNGVIPLQTANNNGILLAALLYKVQGPILQARSGQTQIWDTNFAGTEIRGKKCHPTATLTEDQCPFAIHPTPVIGRDIFQYCEAAMNGEEIRALNCKLEKYPVTSTQKQIEALVSPQ